jgi:hypothetical protein
MGVVVAVAIAKADIILTGKRPVANRWVGREVW